MWFLVRRVVIAGVIVAFVGSGLGLLIRIAWPKRVPLDPERTLSQAIELLRAYRLDEAEPLLDAYLQAYPDGVNGHLLMAQLALERAERSDPPDATLSRQALDHLARIPNASPTPPHGMGLKRPVDDVGERALAALVRLYDGKARSNLARPALAEADWSGALRLSPQLVEAGWLLLDLYLHQGREADARRLGLRLAEQEPDARKRLEWLLTVAWLDVARVAPQRVIQRFEKAVRLNQGDRHTAIALGLALIREHQDVQGLDILRRTAAGAPDDPNSLAALLTGLSESQRTQELVETVAQIPPPWVATALFAEHIGRAAAVRGDWPSAATALRRAWETEPHRIELAYQFVQALRLSGKKVEADRFNSRINVIRQERDELLEMYRRLLDHPESELRDVHDIFVFTGGAAAAAQALIRLHDAASLRRFAELCEDLGFPDQARAWRRALAELYPSAP